MLMKELIAAEERRDRHFDAAIHGVEIDGGGDGSGLGNDLSYDPTQGKGTSAWQESQRRSLESNAEDRRN